MKKTAKKKLSIKTFQHLKKNLSYFAGVAVVLATMSGYFGVKAQAATVTPKIAIVYGDSITFESGVLITGKMNSHAAWKGSIVQAWPGIAVCDMLPILENELATLHPYVVSLEVQGNSLTPCMGDGNGGYLLPGTQAYNDKYQADIDTFFREATATGAKVVFIKTLPSSRGDSQVINNIALAEAGKFHGVSISSSPRNAVTLSGKFTWEKNCTTSEITHLHCNPDGKVTVRNPDGLHLCPVYFDMFAGCPVYSGGETRYASAAAATTLSPPKPILP